MDTRKENEGETNERESQMACALSHFGASTYFVSETLF